jgi:hypothetical protein|nr:MAG TPA: hypothetical protein [Caudoviricetes sp.]
MNNYKVEIYDDITKSFVDYTKYALNPIRHADLLDEQLDEASLTMKQVPAEIFQPLTYVKITHTNISEGIFSDTYLERIKKRSDRTTIITIDNGKVTETLALFYVIANDNSIEVPVGSGRYDHTLYLIELTKILEGFIGDSITFTNALGNNYTSGADTLNSGHYGDKGLYKTPSLSPLKIYSFEELYTNYPKQGETSTVAYLYRIYVYSQDDYDASVRKGITIKDADTPASKSGTYLAKYLTDKNGGSVTLNNGVYVIEYLYQTTAYPPSGGEQPLSLAAWTYTMSVTENRYPAKKWTITDVINRCFALIEPQTLGNYPRFRLQGVSYDTDGNPLTTYEAGSQAEEFEKILAPEFAFTKMTLREQLKQVGGFIHAEPRISAFKTDNKGNEYFEVVFDKYGGIKQSHIKDRQLISAGFKESINEYCTALDSSADNLVSQVDFAQGVVVEPFENGFTTLRTENITTRLEENNDTIIPTDKPIFQIKSVICKYIPGKGSGNWDITPYVFESADYNGNLSSYGGVYPYSKSYAVYYTQGSKGIKGLFFKAESPISPALKNYAITNILRTVTGDSSLTIGGDGGILKAYAELGFEITYLPIFKTRIKTTKQQIRTGLPRTLAYNQSANMIETRYYGANLKGVVERLGNLEKTYTYIVPFLSDIPTAGMVFDKNYYISTVTWEVLPYYIKVTLGLSKDFNRISEYIGINSEKRMWEVSERMSVERQTLIQEYVVFSDKPRTKKGKDVYFQKGAFSLTGWLFNDSSTVSGSNPISACSVRPMNKNKANVGNYVILPSVAVSFGNSALFAVNYADNYSAGQKIVKESKDNDLKGYWGQYVPAADYYGRAYYLTLSWTDKARGIDATKADALPQKGNLDTTDIIKVMDLRYRKDNREQPSLAYELSAVTDNDEFIIGEALMSNSALVNRSPILNGTTYGKNIEVRAFTTKLNKFAPDTTGGNFIGHITIHKATEADPQEWIQLPTVPADDDMNYVAWGIVTPYTTTVIQVEDEDGQVKSQAIQTGGKLLLGRNEKPNGQKIYVSLDTVL